MEATGVPTRTGVTAPVRRTTTSLSTVASGGGADVGDKRKRQPSPKGDGSA